LIREAAANFYASEEWVHAHGHPRTGEEAAHLPFVGADRSGQFLGYLRQHGLPLHEANFSCYADHSVAHWALVRQGMGIGQKSGIGRTPTRGIDDRTPFGKAGTSLEIFRQALGQSVQPLGDQIAACEGQFFGPFIHFDARNCTGLFDDPNQGCAVGRILPNGLIVENDPRNVLHRVRVAEQDR